MIGKPKAEKAPKPPKPPKPARVKGGKAKAAKAPKTKAAKPKRKPARPEGAWVTAEGYRLTDRLVALDPQGPGGDLIVALANEILDQHVRLGRRGLAVCASAEGAGVTFVAANLAIALAQAGVSTLLVDANLESPGLQDLIAPPQDGPGLHQLLADESLPLLDAVRPDVLPGLSLLYAGEPTGGVEEDGLATERFEAVAQRCLRDFGLTIFDTPAANRSTSARAISVATGYALLVARRNVTFADDVITLSGQLDQDGVMVVGSVLNRA